MTASRRLRPGRGVLLACLMLLVGGAATVIAAEQVASSSQDLRRSRFEAATDQAVELLRAELDRFAAVGGGAAAAVQEFPNISPTRYEALLDDLVRDVDLDGILGLSATFRVGDGAVEGFAARQDRLQPAFDLRPAPGDEHAFIARTWPFEANQAALGFDVFGNPDGAVALRRSLETDRPQLSEPTALQQALDRTDGLVLYLPWRTSEGDIAGWVGVVMQGSRLVSVLQEESELRVRVTDVEPTEERSIGEVGGAIEDAPSNLRAQRTMEVYGQTWQVVAAPRDPVPSSGVGLVVVGGLLATIVVAALVFRLSDSASSARRLVEERTRDLQHANRALAQTNRDLADTNHQLEVASRSKDDLLSVVSHELRTPLTVIHGFAQTLRAALLRSDDTGLIDLAAERIEANARRLEGVVENLLAAAQLAAHGDLPSPQDVEVSGVVQEAVHSWIPGGARAEVEIPAGATVHTDPTHLRAILEQLLTNAVKYGAEPYRVEAMSAADRVDIVVGDAGAGMDPEEAAALFDRFAQGSTGDTRTTSGVGLGLWLVREMAERNGGEVRYERDGGSRFVVSFPSAGTRALDVH